ncbi:23S rRNA (uracil(1939)-C(5))-methyltransferase RlmD [Cyanobium sp. WAJ14-Wanaka]|uniref:23S rRNA (uracil(1939)-C(5))-methyltransferase RlmD n=1 Tax=Cyanobium sp. WAJ14-Wanaka TaxID=2823725 RepID=UPI0020CF315F|nr:23S rRNA (uracil(1939)-C(5))-methyltransferase RlmD [Cyanobium sp. WAJ14-Wanaka]MCP9774551.1 23S rRNA (uracil(1939)-C(5))-methyltransferase RlmD [Cyanobium sp. WAJ14-Wanaka]
MENPVVGSRATVQITGLSHDGQGVARIGDQVLFVADALQGESVEVQLTHKAKRHWLARLLTVNGPSPDRQKPPCILAADCGGCAMQHLSDGGQVAWKHQKVVDAMQRIAHIDEPVLPLLSSDNSMAYRNRAIIPLERQEDGRLRAGYYRRGTHRIVNMNQCPVLDPRIDCLIAPLKHDLETSDWPVDCDLIGEGGLRHLALRVGINTGEVLLTLVSSHDDLDGLAIQAAHWMARWPELVGVCLNLQPKATNTLMGPETRVIAGRSWLREQFFGLELRIAADTFFQVNTPQAERIVPLLLQAIDPLPLGVMVDAYCGIGTYSLPIAAAGWTVHGIELSAEAVAQAKVNAVENDVADRATYEAGIVSRCLPEHLVHCDVLFLDPPRKGLDGYVLAAILDNSPQSLIYLSCDPATLARDLASLVKENYLLESIQPIDFFPQTSHVETLAILRRR